MPSAKRATLLATFVVALAACGRAPEFEKITAPTIDSHEPYFPIARGKHSNIQCNTCHGAFDSFEKFDCIGCHTAEKTNPAHPGVDGYAWESQACYRCHPKGEADGAGNHQLFFPIGAGTRHDAIACATCHVDPNDRKKVDCTSCHDHAAAAMAHVHPQVGGYAWDSASCLRCHADAQVNRVRDHAQLKIQQGNKHFQQSCLMCHPNMRQDKPFGADFKTSDCLGCHRQPATDPAHAGIAGYGYANAKCLSCHPDGESGAIDHRAFFPIATGTKHATASCTDCHTDPANRKVITCTGCHEHAQATLAPAHASVGGYTYDSAACLKCHADSQVNAVAAHTQFKIQQGTGHFQQSCLLCHPDVRADKPWGENFATTNCLGCHTQPTTDPKHTGVSGYGYSNSQCLSCHPDGEGGSVNHTDFFPIGTGASHAGVSCSTCHTDPANRKVITCTGCHEHDQATMSPKHSQVGGYQWSSSLCLRCHAESQVNRVSAHSQFPISSWSKHSRQSCVVCHPNLRTDRPWGADFSTFKCYNCHASAHHRSSGDAGCYRCHPQGDD